MANEEFKKEQLKKAFIDNQPDYLKKMATEYVEKNGVEFLKGKESFTILLDKEDIEYLKTCKRAYAWQTAEMLAAWAIKVWVARRRADEKRKGH